MAKAFDTTILCSKLIYYGFQGASFDLLGDYLTGRQQRMLFIGDIYISMGYCYNWCANCNSTPLFWIYSRPESIMLQNLPIILFSISQFFLPILLIFMLPKYKIDQEKSLPDYHLVHLPNQTI